LIIARIIGTGVDVAVGVCYGGELSVVVIAKAPGISQGIGDA